MHMHIFIFIFFSIFDIIPSLQTQLPLTSSSQSSKSLDLESVVIGNSYHDYIFESKIRNLGLIVKYSVSADDSIYCNEIYPLDSFNSDRRANDRIHPLYLPTIESSTAGGEGFLLGSNHHIQVLSRINLIINNYTTCLRNNGSYYLNENIFKGGHGEVWRAYKVSSDGFLHQKVGYILKRMHIAGSEGQHILSCANREIYFGSLFRDFHSSLPIARFVNKFREHDDFYLVFRDEGISLQKLLYAASFSDSFQHLEPSSIWKKLRTTKSGALSFKGIIYQLLSALESLHSLDILHRDIKPGNILLRTEYSKDNPSVMENIKLLLADFSSAVSDDAIAQGLYDASNGPSIAGQETIDYAPPEVILSQGTDQEIPYSALNPLAYDMWSVGIVFLEMLLGTAEVFSVDQRSSALIIKKLHAMGIADHRKVLFLAALADYRIFDPAVHLYDYYGDSASTGNSHGNDEQSRPMRSQDIKDEGMFSERVAVSMRSADSGVKRQSSKIAIVHKNVKKSECVEAEDSTISGAICGNNDNSETNMDHGIGRNKLVPVSTSLSASQWLNNDLIALFAPTLNVPSISNAGSDANNQENARTSRHPFNIASGSQQCQASTHQLQRAILKRDLLGLGFHDRWGLDLLAKLLEFDPSRRITAHEALRHAYFMGVGSYRSAVDGEEFGTLEEMQLHDEVLLRGRGQGKRSRRTVSHNGNEDANEEVNVIGDIALEDTEDDDDGLYIDIDMDNDDIGTEMDMDESYSEENDGSDGDRINHSLTATDDLQGLEFSADLIPVQGSSCASGIEDSNINFIYKIPAEQLQAMESLSHLKALLHSSPYKESPAPLVNPVINENDIGASFLSHSSSSHRSSSEDFAVTNDVKSRALSVSAPVGLSETLASPLDLDNSIEKSTPPTLIVDDPNNIPDPVKNMTFQCPKCNRTFHANWHACHAHVTSRRHGKHSSCQYDRSLLPNCLSENSLLPLAIDEHSGWCELQGRRSYVEDHGAIVFEEHYRFFGVFDGHFGKRAATVAAQQIQRVFHLLISDIGMLEYNDSPESQRFDTIEGSQEKLLPFEANVSIDSYVYRQEKVLKKLNNHLKKKINAEHIDERLGWQSLFSIAVGDSTVIRGHTASNRERPSINASAVSMAIFSSFLQTDSDLSTAYSNPSRARKDLDSSGTTASVAIVFPETDHLLIAHVGDSRAVVCCHITAEASEAIALTVDHTPYDSDEALAVAKRGGNIVRGDGSHGVLRVDGKLAVTRSLGDSAFHNVISPIPDILVLKLQSRNYAIENSRAQPISTERGAVKENSCWEYREALLQRKAKGVEGEFQFREALFTIIGSDGLWDVVSNDEAADIVCEYLLSQSQNTLEDSFFLPADAMHHAAKRLAQEAFVRGSSDNIGVCIIDLQ